ncbi:formylmethanofuran--tetrahydromethanopterin N-formyltransferase [Candidatus Bathyarchaeota archaeon]|nr:formylmethanofuran--tetrahydromethanopterin N-formyltransferase [Candidatus Bathyarchaeota archaeon]
MSPKETESKSIKKENSVELVRKDGCELIVKDLETGNICSVEDTYAEMFPMWAGRILITAANEKWALIAARTASGFASSIIMSPAESAVEGLISADETPDGRPGVIIQIYHNSRNGLKQQMSLRIGQCIMTCPTTAAFDALPKAKRRVKIGRSLRLFGDGFQKSGEVAGRKVWRIPVMEGEFIVEDDFGIMKAVASGNMLILAKDWKSALKAAEDAKEAITKNVNGVIMPFPGGLCRAGSKVGSLNYKLPASTSHQYCPTIKKLVPDTKLSEKVNSVQEIVINGLNQRVVKAAMGEGIKAAIKVPGVLKITAGNYGGKLGPYKANLKEVLDLE